MTGPELSKHIGTVVHPLTPRTSPLRWSTNKPTIDGWFFCRIPDQSNMGWQTRCIKCWARNPAELRQAAWAPDQVFLLTDKFFERAQWAHEPVQEPLGG